MAAEAAESAIEAGVRPDRIIIDPGSVLAKQPSKTCSLKPIDELRDLSFPILLGISRKALLGTRSICAGRSAWRQHGSQRLGRAARGRHLRRARREGNGTPGRACWTRSVSVSCCKIDQSSNLSR